MSVSSPASPTSTNILGLYFFFSRLLPGTVLLVALIVVLPREALGFISTPLILVVLVVGFGTGQFVHSLAVILESELITTRKTHRDYFEEHLASVLQTNEADGEDADTDPVAEHFADVFRDTYGVGIDELPPDRIYTYIRSRIEIDGRGRTAQYQALRSFSRSMSVVTSLILLVFVSAYVGTYVGFLSTVTPLITALSAGEFVLTCVVLLVCTGIFSYGNEFYKDIYAKYLIIDFVNIIDTK